MKASRTFDQLGGAADCCAWSAFLKSTHDDDVKLDDGMSAGLKGLEGSGSMFSTACVRVSVYFG